MTDTIAVEIASHPIAALAESFWLAVQAPVPYLNRAIAEEQLGVDAAGRQDATLARHQFSAAVQVSILCFAG